MIDPLVRPWETIPWTHAAAKLSGWVGQQVLGLVDLGGEVVRPALVGMQLHHQAAMRGADRLLVGAGLEAEDAIGLLARHRGAGRGRGGLAARCRGSAPVRL